MSRGFFLLECMVYIMIGCTLVLGFMRVVTQHLIVAHSQNKEQAYHCDFFLVQRLLQDDIKTLEVNGDSWIKKEPYELSWLDKRNGKTISWKINDQKLMRTQKRHSIILSHNARDLCFNISETHGIRLCKK